MKVEYKKSFIKDIKRIKDRNILDRLEAVLLDLEKIESLADLNRPGSGIVTIRGTTNYFRIRIGDYRLGIKWNDDCLVIIRFLSRGEIYRCFP